MFANNLKSARKKANYSQETVAEIINTSRSNISKYETGYLEPNLETLKKLCLLYKVSADELLEIEIDEKVNKDSKKNINIKQYNNEKATININNK